MQVPSIEEVRRTVEDRFDVEALEAHGGMGAVFRGRHRSLDSPVAIKVLPIPATLDPDQLARFRREAMTAAKLPHPNIVPVYEFEVSGDMAYLVMPLINGPSLQAWLKKHGSMSFAEAWKLLSQVGSALQFAHDRDIIHRDIKPANILLDQDTDRWMVADFGLARAIVPSKDSQLTVTGMVVGTPAYMPPEQATGGAVDARADLYALGSVVYECLTGEMFGLDQTRAGAESRLCDMGFSPARARHITAPLEFDPQARPPSVNDWLVTVAPTGSKKLRVAIAAGVSLILASASVVLVVLLVGQRVPESTQPVVAMLPILVLSGQVPEGWPDDAVQSMFEEQLRSVPGQGLITSQALIVSARGGPGLPVPHADSLAAVGLDRGATTIFAVSVEFLAGDSIRLSARVGGAGGDPETFKARGPVDSLPVFVSSIVVDAFVNELALEEAGLNEAMPRDVSAAVTYVNGRRLFRQAAYHNALERFQVVIAADSTFAPAYFWAMFCEVMRTRPTRATRATRSALEAALRYGDRLPPSAKALLDAYRLLVEDGDVVGAYAAFAEHAEQNPTLADAWFMKGYLEFYFAPLLRINQRQAQVALQKARDRDPGFAVPYALLGWIAMAGAEPNKAVAQRNFRSYLSIDSVSVWADLIRMADSAAFGGTSQALKIRESLYGRPVEALEYIVLAGGALDITKTDRLMTDQAIVALVSQATLPSDKQMVFRMQAARLFAARRLDDWDELRREASSQNTPGIELDYWTLLLGVTRLLPVPNPDSLSVVARRLAKADDPVALWLAARWLGDAAEGARAKAQLDALRDSGYSILVDNLLGDLAAWHALAAGDSASALTIWGRSTERHQIEDVFFGLVGSLWPLQLDRARVAFAMGRYQEVLNATAQFEKTVGFMDQVAWFEGLRLRANAFQARDNREIPDARRLRGCLTYVLEKANGAGVAEYEEVAAEWGVTGGSPTCRLP